MCDWRNDQSAVVFKPNEPTIEQMVDARRQQQSVLTVQSLLVGRIAPRLAMARNQMNGIPVIRHLDSIFPTLSLNRPCPFLARMMANRSVSEIKGSVATPCSIFRSQDSRSSVETGFTFAADMARDAAS